MGATLEAEDRIGVSRRWGRAGFLELASKLLISYFSLLELGGGEHEKAGVGRGGVGSGVLK